MKASVAVGFAPSQLRSFSWSVNGPALAAALFFVLLYAAPFAALARDWWSDPDSAHGLLLAPLAVFLAWKSGLYGATGQSNRVLGSVMLLVAVTVRYLATLAAELFTLRMSMLLALAGTIVFLYGWRQLLRWWLPAGLLVLSVPLPDIVLSAIALPLQLRASAIGAALLEWRHVPVLLAGNVIYLPGQSLFVTEACSGLRSLSALIALAMLMGGVWLTKPISRAAVLLLAVPIAILLNCLRVFFTGYLVYFGSPTLGTGFMHWTEGWAFFAAAFAITGALTALLVKTEQRLARRRRA